MEHFSSWLIKNKLDLIELFNTEKLVNKKHGLIFKFLI